MLPLFIVISSLVPVGGPDEIVLLNGEVLHGRVEAVGQDGVVFVREESFQPRRISWEEIEIRGILTTTSVTLHLINGDRLSGTIAGVEGGYLKLISPVLGEIALEVASLREALSAGETPRDLVYERAVEQEVEQIQEEVAKDPDQILEPGPWTGSVALVGTLRYGGTDAGLAKLDFAIGKNWKTDRFDAGRAVQPARARRGAARQAPGD